MIFDLKSGKRRRVVQIVFGFLAVIFFLGFVGFGIGGDVSGGIFDALGFGSGDTGSSSPQYEEQIEDAETTLETDPTNGQALAELARYNALSARENGIETDPMTGVTTIAEDARSDLEESVAAWERYLDTKPRSPDASVAVLISQAYRYLEDFDRAAVAQEIVAEEQGSFLSYLLLARDYYSEGEIKRGDAAGDRAVAAADASQRASVRKETDALAKLARELKERLEKQREQGGAAGGAAIEDPFSGLGAGGESAPAPVP